MSRLSRVSAAAVCVVFVAVIVAYAVPQVRIRLRLFEYGIAQGTADGQRGWQSPDEFVYWMMVPPRDEIPMHADPMHPPKQPDTPEWHLIHEAVTAPPARQRSYVHFFLTGYRLALGAVKWRTVILTTLAGVFVALVLIFTAIRTMRRLARAASAAGLLGESSGGGGEAQDI